MPFRDQPSRATPPRRVRSARGFTLIEAAMVMVIIGIGVLSMLELIGSGTVSNNDAAEVTTAMTLAGNIRELSLGLAYYDPNFPAPDPDKPETWVWDRREALVKDYDNITDLDGVTDTWNHANDPSSGYQKFSPPIDGTKREITGYDKWAQHVKVETVDPTRVRTVLPHAPLNEAVRVTVRITRDNALVYTTSWVVFAQLAREPVPE